MMELQQLTIDSIRDIHPCYDPVKFLPADWKGTVVDILEVSKCPAVDRLWVAVHFIPDNVLYCFISMIATRVLDEFFPSAENAYASAMMAMFRALGYEMGHVESHEIQRHAYQHVLDTQNGADNYAATAAYHCVNMESPWLVAMGVIHEVAYAYKVDARSKGGGVDDGRVYQLAHEEFVELLLWLVEGGVEL